MTTQPNEDHQYARLGVEVTDSPGVGVDVVAVDGPADRSGIRTGIRTGDYVMSFNAKHH